MHEELAVHLQRMAEEHEAALRVKEQKIERLKAKVTAGRTEAVRVKEELDREKENVASRME